MSSPEEWLKELFEAKFSGISEKIGAHQASNERRFAELSEHMKSLTGALINKEVFDELAQGYKELSQENKRLDDRVQELETKARIALFVISGVIAVLAPLVIAKLQELFQ